jgi:hypothetical protein
VGQDDRWFDVFFAAEMATAAMTAIVLGSSSDVGRSIRKDVSYRQRAFFVSFWRNLLG